MPRNTKPSLTPKLRFPEFRDKPGWEERRLENVCDLNPSNNGLPDTFFYIDLEAVELGHLKAKTLVAKGDAPSRAQRLLKVGDVIFQIVRPYQRNNLFFNIHDSHPFVASTGYAQLRAHENESFLYHAIHTDPFVSRVIAQCTGSSYPAINSSDLAVVPLAIPSPAEQQKIAECLSSLDELIGGESQKLDALKAHKKGLMQQLFPREGETLPRLRFSKFRKAPPWKLKKIGSMLIETPRPVEMHDETEYSLVTVKRRYGGVVSRGILRGREILVKSQFFVKQADFLISKRQIVHNACGLVPGELDGAIVSNEYSVLRPREGCDIRFFDYFAQQPRISESFMQCSVGIVIEKMLFKLDRWLRREFLFPSFEEQQRIAVCLSSLDGLVADQSDWLAVLQTHKQGLLQQLFPSPIEVRT